MGHRSSSQILVTCELDSGFLPIKTTSFCAEPPFRVPENYAITTLTVSEEFDLYYPSSCDTAVKL